MDTFRLEWQISTKPPKHHMLFPRWRDTPGIILFDFWFAINGTRQIVTNGYALSFTELHCSTFADGRFYIYTCSCGNAACAGVYGGVEIVHVDGKTLWHDLDDDPTIYVFDAMEYTSQIRQAYEELALIKQQYPSYSSFADFSGVHPEFSARLE